VKYTNKTGWLIAFEGLDGAGKTTQRKLLKDWLEGAGHEVVVTKWNSSPLFKPLIKARKAIRALSPQEFAVLHAADFRHRYETVIEPSLGAGKIVLADRYIFTGIARDVARGLDRDWSRNLYRPARWPDVVFYFAISPETCAKRIAASCDMKFYEAGQDVTNVSDPVDSYLRFAPKVFQEYEKLSREFGFVPVDAERPIYAQHRYIRDAFELLTAETRTQELNHAPDFQPDVASSL
jgi:dTMP kinase